MFRILLIISLLCSWSASQAELPVAKEYQIKSVFLYNFISFVKWPNEAFTNDFFNICIVGEDPFKQAIDIAVENENVSGYPIIVKRLEELNAIEVCQMLFVSKSQADYVTDILTLFNTFTLTISDIDGFMEQNGMIQFFNRGKKVRFWVNPERIKEAGLKVSGNLLRIAKIYRSR